MGEDKMSITELQSLISAETAESDDEDIPLAKKRGRGRPKTPLKQKPNKSPKKASKKSPKISPASKGTRRSKRVFQEEDIEAENSIQDSQEEATEEQVVDDKTIAENESDECTNLSEPTMQENKALVVENETAEFHASTDNQITEKTEESPEETQIETFVIEPKAVQKRGRKRKNKKPE